MEDNLRPQYPCKRCVYHHAEFKGVTTDEEGQEKPIFIHYCEDRIQRPIELEFGCGRFKEKGL